MQLGVAEGCGESRREMVLAERQRVVAACKSSSTGSVKLCLTESL